MLTYTVARTCKNFYNTSQADFLAIFQFPQLFLYTHYANLFHFCIFAP